MPSFYSFLSGRAFIILFGFLVLIVTAGLSGCEPAPASQDVIETSICTLESPLVNVYRAAQPQPWANTIFEYAFPPYIPTPIPPNPMQLNEQQILGARYAAFQKLINETEHWSNTQVVNLDEFNNKANITLTFISPELFQAVFLNEVLENRFPTYGFQGHVQSILNAIAERDELLFLLTVTMTNNSSTPHTIKIPIQKMVIDNAENLLISHTHNDHNLDQSIDTLADPVFGYLAYPLAILSKNQCEWVLDPKYNTNIVIDVPYVEVDGVSNDTLYSWTIPYKSLISPILPTITTVPTLPPEFSQNQNLYPMTSLPLPPNGNVDQTKNWQDFSRFVWGQITQGNY